jgi:hypothetical protein
MANFIFRCPDTSFNVQCQIKDDGDDGGRDVYEAVRCLACDQLHFINRKTGRLLGEKED